MKLMTKDTRGSYLIVRAHATGPNHAFALVKNGNGSIRVIDSARKHIQYIKPMNEHMFDCEKFLLVSNMIRVYKLCIAVKEFPENESDIVTFITGERPKKV